MASPADKKLLAASYHGNVSVIKEALEEGANPNCVDHGETYQTPLSYAAASGEADAVKLLLKGGADIKKSIIAIFMAEDNDEILRLLVGADPDFVFVEFNDLDFDKGVEYEKEKRILQEARLPESHIRDDPELKRILKDIRFAQKIKNIARPQGGGSRRRATKKRTYRRRTLNR